MVSSRRCVLGALGLGAAGLAGCLVSESPDSDDSSTAEAIHADYKTTDVSVESDGEELGSVRAAIADTADLRYTGLSDTVSLPANRGMLFVFNTADSRTFAMREMDFALDIVYADTSGTVTEIHHAPEPGPNENGTDQEYPGFGQYVLEVNYDWTTDRGIESGDRLRFEL